MAFIFKKLDIYNKAVDFVEEITTLTKDFPKGTYFISDQLNRASLSISLNIAEGNGRYHKNERKNFFRISRGSAFECIPLIELCKRRNLIETELATKLESDIERLSQMLSGLINNIK